MDKPEKAYLKSFGTEQVVKYPLDQIRYRSDDGRLLEVVNPMRKLSEDNVADLKQLFDMRQFSRNPVDRSGVWRFREFLSAFAPYDNIITMREGNTPIYTMPVCAAYSGMKELFVKHQGFNPTGSFKDNGMTTAVTMAKKLGARMVACASTGNTSASMAAYAARSRMKSIVFIPEGQIAYGKLSQALDYGSLTIQISGDFDKAMQVVQDVCKRGRIYLLNSINPFRIEGQKTIMIEMLHQLDWKVPDWVVVPGGNLGNSSSFGKAFAELKACGFITKVPRIAIIQAEGANPLYSGFASKERVLKPVSAQTRATAIKIGNPVSFDKALYAVDSTEGLVEQVSETEIAIAKSRIGADGIGSEPASATTVAGVKKLVEKGFMHSREKIICILTGHLLKDPDYTVDFHKDELYADAKRTSSVSGGSKIDTGDYSNKPVQLPADVDKLLDYIDEHAHSSI
ncbi:MAG: threonine synthase [Chitinivibrionales bacterium]|nr:threonine synthase [Chitinivibrionales bacterium]